MATFGIRLMIPWEAFTSTFQFWLCPLYKVQWKLLMLALNLYMYGWLASCARTLPSLLSLMDIIGLLNIKTSRLVVLMTRLQVAKDLQRCSPSSFLSLGTLGFRTRQYFYPTLLDFLSTRSFSSFPAFWAGPPRDPQVILNQSNPLSWRFRLVAMDDRKWSAARHPWTGHACTGAIAIFRSSSTRLSVAVPLASSLLPSLKRILRRLWALHAAVRRFTLFYQVGQVALRSPTLGMPLA